MTLEELKQRRELLIQQALRIEGALQAVSALIAELEQRSVENPSPSPVTVS